MKVAARPFTAQRLETYFPHVLITVLLPISATVGMTVQSLAELDDWFRHPLEHRALRGILWPSAGRQMHPAWGTFKVRLDVCGRRIGDLGCVTRSTPECIARSCGFKGGWIRTEVLKQGQSWFTTRSPWKTDRPLNLRSG